MLMQAKTSTSADFTGNKPLISTFIVPLVRKASRSIHLSVIDDFLISCEVDAYLKIETSKERFGDSITFMENIDCDEIKSFGSTEEFTAIRSTARRMGQVTVVIFSAAMLLPQAFHLQTILPLLIHTGSILLCRLLNWLDNNLNVL
jgi:hypothetical protein